MIETYKAFGIGSEVLIDGSIPARVTAIQIRDGGAISYEVLWWNERDRHVEWVESWEVKADGEKARMARIDPVL